MSEHTVVFREGVHYAVDEEGHADLEQPLRWENGAYRPAEEGEPLHNDVNHEQDLELDPGGEE